MKNIFVLGALTLLCHASAFAQSSPSQAIQYTGLDIRPVVEFLSQEVVRLDIPMTIFNWSQNAKVNTNGYAQNSAETFWRAYGGQAGAQNMYGAGLYAAVDPVSTASYGGLGPYYGLPDRWLLLEMQLPVGLRMIDVDGTYTSASTPPNPSEEVLKITNQFQCPTSLNARTFFTNGGVKIEAKCQALIKYIYKDVLQIQAFAYGYSRTEFKDCDRNAYQGMRAFVITDSKWMKPDLLRFYNSKTTDHLEERARIQTLFLKSKSDFVGAISNDFTAVIGTYLTSHPTSQLKGSTTACDNDTCTITVQFCDPAGVCDKVALQPLPRPGGPVITSREAVRTDIKSLLWPDLEGQPKTPTISSWLKNNMYLCSGKVPYSKRP